MEAYIRHRGLPPSYVCNVQQNWSNERWLQEGEQRSSLGIWHLVFGIICMTLYIPCIIVIIRKDLRRFAAYKFLVVITLCDFHGLFLNSIVSGIFFIKGVVFCNYPNFIYLLGCGSLFTWTGTCSTCCVLSFSRLIDLWSSTLHDKIFAGKRICGSLVFIFAYMGYFYLFANPIVFNSREMKWTFDPRVYTDGSHVLDYAFYPNVLNNALTVGLTLLLNFLFIASFIYKSYFFNFKLTKIQKQMFILSAFTGFNAFMASTIFISYLFIEGGLWLNYLGLLFWQLSTANDLVLFLWINASVRSRVFRLILRRKSDSKRATAPLQRLFKRRNCLPGVTQ